jgi:hypothetical protein
MPTEHNRTPITLAARRATAAAVVAEASGLGVLTAALLVDCVDLVTAAILGSVGLDAVEVRPDRCGNLGGIMTDAWDYALTYTGEPLPTGVH